MNKLDLFEKYREKIPFVYDEVEGFRNSIKKILDDYLDDVNSLCDGLYNGFKEDLKIYVDGIKNIIDLSYQGGHSDAFILFKELMDKHKLKSNIENKISSIDKIFFYRIRKVPEDRTSISYNDMFHIPLNNRGIIKTQRYSFPGYPCLYLGTSINACWEELRRPSSKDCMISALNLSRMVRYIDLSLPNKNDIVSSQLKLERFIMSFPLILTCSVKVLNYLNSYKPEYIVPQLLMEYIIDKNNKPNRKLYSEIIWGVLYTSVHINSEYKFSDKEFINWAIPVIEPLSDSRYCPILCDVFRITKPICEKLELTKTCNLTFLSGEYSSNYEKSSFFKLEKRLKDSDFYKIKD